ncbi:MAG: response regulator [Anaerolineae bacterium]
MAKILVVDDERLIRDYIVELLQFAGFETLSAKNGEEGLKTAIEQVPDAIVSDVTMPGLDGFGFLDALRANRTTNTIPVIMLTAISDFDHVRQGMTGGAADYLSKTVSPNDLIAAVNTQLEKQKIIRQKHDTDLRILRKNIVYALPHEFRTPLSIIMGYGVMLESNYEDTKPSELLQASAAITKASQRLEKLIENYLVYAQVELIADDPEQVVALRNHITRDVSVVIASSAQEIAGIHNRSSDLKLELVSGGLRISEHDLKKIVEEIVDNAFKFSNATTSVCIKSQLEKNEYVITVTDEGIGVKEEQIKMMGAFMQFERTLHEQQGVGLGFSIARRLSQLYNGNIELCSQFNQGTTVTIMLPIG